MGKLTAKHDRLDWYYLYEDGRCIDVFTVGWFESCDFAMQNWAERWLREFRDLESTWFDRIATYTNREHIFQQIRVYGRIVNGEEVEFVA